MPEIEGCQPGRRATVELKVDEGDLASTIGTGDVPVLSTPRLLALAEQAAVQSIAGCLPAEHTSVGSKATVEHRKPTFVGGRVQATAVLMGVHGRRLEFSITLTDEAGAQVGSVRHQRVVVDRHRFGG